MKINLPKNVEYILNTLNVAGYDSFVVGGAVRDSLLNLPIKDYDITTNATPEQIKSLFEHTIPTGEKHGTITVVLDNICYELTQYRIDGKYSNGRHPDSIQFTNSLEEDLKRRDFTINAIAYHPEIGLVDPFDGQKDLENRLIKCVGIPFERLEEDFLRIIRAYRFALTYNFTIDLKTHATCLRYLRSNSLKYISKERLQTELDKMLTAPIEHDNFCHFLEIFEFIINQVDNNLKDIDSNKYEEIFRVFDNLDSKDRLAWMLLNYYDSLEQCEKVLKGLKYSNEIQNHIMKLLFAYHEDIPNVIMLKKCIRDYRFDTIERMLNLRYQISPRDEINLAQMQQLKVIRNEKQVVFMKQLAINGDDLMKELKIEQGARIGTMLNKALDAVIEGIISNEREELLKYIFYILRTEESV